MAKRSANMYPKAYMMECPHPECHAEIPPPTGSLYWSEGEIEDVKNPDNMVCPYCGREFKLPKSVRFWEG